MYQWSQTNVSAFAEPLNYESCVNVNDSLLTLKTKNQLGEVPIVPLDNGFTQWWSHGGVWGVNTPPPPLF